MSAVVLRGASYHQHFVGFVEDDFAKSVSSLEVENLFGQLRMVDYSIEIEGKIDLVISKESDKQ